MSYPVYDLEINEDEQDDAQVKYTALVDSPAIKRDFLLFNKENQRFQIVSDTENIIIGPLMIPNQLIYRDSVKLGPHYVKFSEKTILAIAIKFSKKGYQNNVNIMHDPDMVVDGVTMFGGFVTNEKWGVKPIEAFKDLPYGTWFGMFKIENEQVKKRILSGDLKGFSVEGMFDYDTPKMSKEDHQLSQLTQLLNSFQN